MNDIRTFWETCLQQDFSFSPDVAGYATLIAFLLLAIGLSWMFGAVCKRFVTPVVHRLVQRTSTVWDDYLLDEKVLNALFHVLPGLIFCQCLPWCFVEDGSRIYPLLYVVVERCARIYVTVTFIALFTRFLSQLVEAANHHDRFKEYHIVGVVQFAKLIAYCVGGIIIVAILFGRNPISLIAGLGAAATVLMLVFRDSILGLVAGIQLSVNRMLKPGDWVTIDKLGINGIVEKVSLTTVKVRNFDHTISTVPPYTLVSDAFQNWDGMYGKGLRRVKRALYIDVNTIRFCTDADWDALQVHDVLPLVGLSERNDRTVNLRLFRAYAENYLKSLPEVALPAGDTDNKDEGYTFSWVMARQLEPTSHGLPLELWFYFRETDFCRYEALAADCMEHLMAMLPVFGLRQFQSPAGSDLLRWQS